ncbi:hypothetical protein M9H77_10672 [Catharanthus roseus]|uniref:Uncharacterized protein n=1 Tax=Catharanthus roseus TaxID=4058 RepID=A0ACC0BCE3_CATRO|nr:hypothetical protein M9H77_10672 [Catharanthus roseus]
MADNYNKKEEEAQTANVPVIDMNGMHDPAIRHRIVNDISKACLSYGIFQVVNHGISESVMDEALSVGFRFFELPTMEKVKLISNDVYKPVRYGSSIKDGEDKVQFWRVFLKHYANPLEEWINLWPDTPQDYREKMGKYSNEAQKLATKIMGLITEGLGLGPKYLTNKMEKGMQVIFANCYPPCPQPELTLGLAPHSDYSCLTILHQSSPGLQILDSNDKKWKGIPSIEGALMVNVGDHLEVLSNGRYTSVKHRVMVNSESTRISIASLHSMGMDEKMETAKELIDQKHPKAYKESSFGDFLNFLAHNDFVKKNFIDTLRLDDA